jgi:hypothetical protein
MNQLILFIICIGLMSCGNNNNGQQALQKKIDSLEIRLADSYKPGFGEFMSSIQIHHAKLWFAGQNQNWKLADFEINEIKEALEDLNKYCNDRPEIKSIGMINPPLDSITSAIQQKDPGRFKSYYILLTNTCNSCHQQTQHEFNVIRVPSTPPFSNQDFELKKNEKNKQPAN